MSDRTPDYSFATKLLHNKYKFDEETGAVSVPIQHASTFHQRDFDQLGKYDYGRSLNPTREALEETIAMLEEGTRGFAFSSGMAAISTAFLLVSQGDHVLISEDVYGGTYRLISDILFRYGIEYTFVDMTDLSLVEKEIKHNTKVLYVETPSNPLLKVSDIQAISKLAKKAGAWTFVDNTFLTPALQKPLLLGADLVLHSATKFLSGHSDVVAGLAVTNNEIISERLGFLQNAFGAVLGVQDAWLVLRGLKTLNVRLEQSMRTALKVATFLEAHPNVTNVYYPGITSHNGHDLQHLQAKGAGAVLSFELESEDAVRAFITNVQLPVFAVSLGAVESILSYPAKMSHASMPENERQKRGISNALLRLSVGLENEDDIIKDFQSALELVYEEVARPFRTRKVF